MTPPLLKYPRTAHIEGSRLQAGDEDLDAVPFAALRGCHLVVEEKVDGANAAVSFASDGSLLLQSRGHYLSGGPRERHFALFKAWATRHQAALREVLGERFVLFGEWVFAKHTVFYDRLPHYFLEFDVFDRETATFLSTPRRAELLAGSPVASVPVLHSGEVSGLDELVGFVRPSVYKSPRWREQLPANCLGETDPSDLAEGLYVKHEAKGRVVGRYKWVRASFLAAVADSESHWLDRPIVANLLADGVDLFA